MGFVYFANVGEMSKDLQVLFLWFSDVKWGESAVFSYRDFREGLHNPTLKLQTRVERNYWQSIQC